MNLFWAQGYEGASLEQLRRAMGGLSSASFYAAFGSKEALFREVLDLYLGTHGQVLNALRDETLSPRARIELALRRSACMQSDASHPPGCMITLAATIGSADCTAIQALTARERAANRQAIRACVEEAVAAGALRAETDVAGLAAVFDGLLLGLSLQARDGVPGSAMDAGITAVLAAWDKAA
ncbi:TetR/AcrR family transcriptional regulator [Acidisoma cellulosilytica]|uniref:TetR/AcrR family transcriptional regulator n=1 Tax=Acidisoma cellulosilyticum TaxID=2802395 RepID=A0A964E2A7_9PROT|nr:TetR/AcrR family transcriptional regulator [Acidisoma cellulosilyticum]MCB8879226.1 TetR/AcrR family transcriptional regulator [Acidisoma cellulosilyticum]